MDRPGCDSGPAGVGTTMQFKVSMRLCLIAWIWILLPGSSWSVQGSGWIANCQKIKAKFQKKPDLNVMFSSPSINRKSTVKYWQLRWRHSVVPLPAIQYRHVYINKDKHGFFNVILLNRDKSVIISLFAFETKQYDDLFATSSVAHPEPVSTAEGRRMTRQLFGGPVSYADMRMSGLSVTPDSIRCKNRTIWQDKKIIYLLGIKSSMGPSVRVAAHKIAGKQTGWLEVHNTRKSKLYIAYLVSSGKADKDYLLQLRYDYSVPGLYDALPYSFVSRRQQMAERAPAWLRALNQALATKKPKDWRLYTSSAEKAGISQKSIKHLLKMLKR